MIEGAIIDQGTGYDREPSTSNPLLTEVGRGTPMGEMLRRYWHPVGLVTDAVARPRKVRALGEDLILFRKPDGTPGLLHSRCAHRGTTLYYGRVEERGIRCCYHGWLFDTDGRCHEQPCEPEGGVNKGRIRQPWYPIQERYGLIFAYMGPAAKKPILTRYEILDNLEPGEIVDADDTSIGGGGPHVINCNWMQHYDNLPDTFHVPILHGSFSGPQFVEQMGLMPEVKWEYTDKGVKTTSFRTLDDGTIFHRVSEAVLPTLRVIPNPRVAQYARCESIGWVLPIDDTSFRIYTAARVQQKGDLQKIRSRLNGKLWEDLTEDEHQLFPGDHEAMVGQGPITFHSEEHLSTTDTGVGMLRRIMLKQVAAVGRGEDPIGIRFDEAEPVPFDAGNFIIAQRQAAE